MAIQLMAAEKHWKTILALAGATAGGVIGGMFYLQEKQAADPASAATAVATEQVETTETPIQETLLAEEETGPPYSPQLRAVLSELDLPIDNRTKVDGCSTLKSSNKKVSSWEICDDITMSPCAFSSDNTCIGYSNIINGRVSSVGFRYTSSQFSPPEAKALLDKKFGATRWDNPPPIEFPDGSWNTHQKVKWKSGKIEILLMLMAGRRADGEEYMTASLIISDKDVPEPIESDKI